MQTELGLAGAFLVGLLGGVHCVGMCGGIAGSLVLGLPQSVRTRATATLPFLLAYNTGRLGSYAAAGFIMGGLGTLLTELMPVHYAQRILLGVSGLFMVLLGLYLGGWWRILARLENAGGRLWRRIEPLGRRLLPIRTPGKALSLGLVWGWIPCGLVYSMLVWSVSAGSALEGAGLMLAFGLGTLPNLLAIGLLTGGIAHLFKQDWVRRTAGGAVSAFGVYTLWSAF